MWILPYNFRVILSGWKEFAVEYGVHSVGRVMGCQ
jgi:hypothetical protein